MPGMDRTGPMGNGPMTGRGFGNCGNGSGRGFGRGCRFGGGFRRGFQTQAVGFTKEEEKKILEAELKELEAEKKEIEQRLKETK